jgi:hypothetical protein
MNRLFFERRFIMTGRRLLMLIVFLCLGLLSSTGFFAGKADAWVYNGTGSAAGGNTGSAGSITTTSGGTTGLVVSTTGDVTMSNSLTVNSGARVTGTTNIT